MDRARERQRVRRQLMDYCAMDTKGMVWIIDSLLFSLDLQEISFWIKRLARTVKFLDLCV